MFVVLSTEPAVACTVTVKFPVGADVGGGLLLALPPPQPLSSATSIKEANKHVAGTQRKRVRRASSRLVPTPTAAAKASRSIRPGGRAGTSNGNGTSAEPAVWIVSTVVAGFEPGVTEAGLNVQVLPVGNPVQEKEVARVFAPPTGVTVIVEVPDWPWVIVSAL